jgi:putative ATPase
LSLKVFIVNLGSTKSHLPLSAQLRPKDFNSLIGQDAIWSKSSHLRRLVESDSFFNLIFWGPPGTGKTSLATVIGNNSARRLVTLSAVHASVKDIRGAIADSQQRLSEGLKADILFLDEVHRLSKSQQDVLLPALESGEIKFIGATTENPSFSVNSAILSRSLTFHFQSLSVDALITLLKNAVLSDELKITTFDEEAVKVIAQAADGDARRALNLLQSAATTLNEDQRHLSKETLLNLNSMLPIRYDHDGEQHYDTISAFIKAIRGSHPDAAVYYLARMLESGEDPLFIARRLLILASEDVGNANPTALMLAQSTFQAVDVLGMPEAKIPLSQCTTYLASSPKSNSSYLAINDALSEVKKSGSLSIPLNLRNAPTKLMKEEGYSKGYAYAHDDLERARKMTYMPLELKGKKFYFPKPIGTEKQLIENLKHLRPLED